MADVDSGLLKCVLQLAACSDKLRATDGMLGDYVTKMHKTLPPAELPVLKAKLAVVPVGAMAPEDVAAQAFQELFDHGSEAAERLEVMKTRLEKELQRRSDQLQEMVSSRNQDIQEEYARMLKELDDQAESLTAEITAARAARAPNKRRRTVGRANDTTRVLEVERENRTLKEQVDEFSLDITCLQKEFAALENAEEKGTTQETRSDVVQHPTSVELEEQVASLRQEVELLRSAKDSIAAKQTTSFKRQYESEIAEIDEESTHLKQVAEESRTQLQTQGTRLHSLLRTLAPTPSIGTLMTRLHQQLSSVDTAQGSRKTLELKTFLDSCPSVEEGKQAIEELQKLRLLYCYETSGILALAD